MRRPETVRILRVAAWSLLVAGLAAADALLISLLAQVWGWSL